MNMWASRHPEEFEEGVRYEDVHDPDRIKKERKEQPCLECFGTGYIDNPEFPAHPSIAVRVERCGHCEGTGRE